MSSEAQHREQFIADVQAIEDCDADIYEKFVARLEATFRNYRRETGELEQAQRDADLRAVVEGAVKLYEKENGYDAALTCVDRIKDHLDYEQAQRDTEGANDE